MQSVMRWYELTIGTTGKFTWVQDPLYDESGEIIPLFIESSDPAYLRVRDAKPVGDLVRIIGADLIVSDKAFDVMRQSQFDNIIRTRKVKVSRRGAIVPGLEYYWIDSRVNHDVLDQSLAKFKRSPVTGNPLVVTKWVLVQDKMPNCDLFTGNIGIWFCSERLRNSILENNLTNFGFEEVEVNRQ
jgi:hypothetical protein